MLWLLNINKILLPFIVVASCVFYKNGWCYNEWMEEKKLFATTFVSNYKISLKKLRRLKK
jgi:hypothetical protein